MTVVAPVDQFAKDPYATTPSTQVPKPPVAAPAVPTGPAAVSTTPAGTPKAATSAAPAPPGPAQMDPLAFQPPTLPGNTATYQPQAPVPTYTQQYAPGAEGGGFYQEPRQGEVRNMGNGQMSQWDDVGGNWNPYTGPIQSSSLPAPEYWNPPNFNAGKNTPAASSMDLWQGAPPDVLKMAQTDPQNALFMLQTKYQGVPAGGYVDPSGQWMGGSNPWTGEFSDTPESPAPPNSDPRYVTQGPIPDHIPSIDNPWTPPPQTGVPDVPVPGSGGPTSDVPGQGPGQGPNSPATDTSAGLYPDATPVDPENDLRSLQITPGAMLDRFKLAQEQYGTYADSTSPQYQAALRDATRAAAGAGRLGSGLLRTSYGDLANQRTQSLQNERDSLFQNALQGSVTDAQTQFEDLMKEQGYQTDAQNTAFNQAVTGQKLQEELTQGSFTRALDQLVQGNANNPADMQLTLSNIFGNQSSAAGQSMATILMGMANGSGGANSSEWQQLLAYLKSGLMPPTSAPAPTTPTQTVTSPGVQT